MSIEQQSTAELIDKPDEQPETLIVPDEWVKDFQTIRDALAAMGEWKLMTVERHGITKITANRVAAKKMRIRIEELRKELGRAIMLRKSNVDAFADNLKDAVTAVEIALEVIENAHKSKVKAEREQREAEAAKILNQRISQLESFGYIPADIAAVGKMTSPEFLALLDDRRRIFEAAERERAEAEQAERERVEKLERELEESQRRIAELEESQSVKPIVNSNGDTMPPQLGEVIQVPLTGGLMLPAGVEISQSCVTLLPPGHDVQSVADTVRVSLNLRLDDSELCRIGNKLELSADAFRLFMQLSGMEVSAVFVVDKATGVAKLINVNGLTINGNEAPF